MTLKSIHSRAPTRIDLAGGTVDIWPIYLFLKHPLTLNLAINLDAEATIDSTTSSFNSPPGFCLRSLDQKTELKLPWNALDSEMKPPPSLVLHWKLLQFFHAKRMKLDSSFSTQSMILSTQAKSPAGAGLGGSSALSIAMIGALASWALQPIDPPHPG